MLTGRQIYEARLLAKADIEDGAFLLPWDRLGGETKRIYDRMAEIIGGGKRPYVVRVGRVTTYILDAKDEAEAEEAAIGFYMNEEAAGEIIDLDAACHDPEDAAKMMVQGGWIDMRAAQKG